MEEGVEERSYGRSVAATEWAMATMERTVTNALRLFRVHSGS